MATEAELLNEISKLTSDELMVKLINYGVSVGPITGTTRPLFEKKLLRVMGVDQQANIETKDCTPNEIVKKVSPIASDGPCTYFGVQIPLDARTVEDELVFTDKKEALRLVKSYPGSRFKAFPSQKDAVIFSRQNPLSLPPLPKAPMLKSDGKPLNESSAFRGPKPQELVRLRKAIEVGDLNTVRTMIWGNPRYLVSSGDTPTVLQEGFRYNALHVCCQKNQAEVCKFVLDTLQNPTLLAMLYPDDEPDTRLDRVTFITDLYLNMPDKGNNETPLHFACKFGHPEVVEVLMAHPRVDKQRKNRYGEVPGDVVCSRARNATQEVKDRIHELLEDHYYVPLLRSEDNSAPCEISAPWSPEQLARALSPAKAGSAATNRCSSPTEAPRKVKALAGPMSPVQAENFRKHWMTPPSPKQTDKKAFAEIRRSDYEKGLERIGRMIANKMNISWVEYWQFLDSFLDLSSKEGLARLEVYLKAQAEKLNATVAASKQLSSLEQQMGQLNLSDSGEDSGIESKEASHHTPPPERRKSPIKLPSLTGPLPKLVLYTKTPPKDAPKISEASNPAGQGDLTPRSLFSTTSESKKETSSAQNGNVCDNPSDNNPFLLKNIINKVTYKDPTTATLPEDPSNLGGDFLPTKQETNSLPDEKTQESQMNAQNKQPFTSIANGNKLQEQETIMSPHMKVNQFLEGGLNSSPQSPGLQLDQIHSHRRYHMRRNSAASSASTTSDISTDSFHTCREDLWADSDDSDDEFMDTSNDMSNITVITAPKQSSSPVQFFIHGDTPTKEDIDVLRALETTPVSPEEYPHVSKWKETLLSFSERERNSWNSPLRQRISRSTPRREPQRMAPLPVFNSPPSVISSPTFNPSSGDDEVSSKVKSNLMASFMNL